MPLKKKLLIVFLFLTTLFVSLVLFFEILENQKSIVKNEFKKERSHLLINELRQNSDDLIRMARAYAATGEPHFRDSFQRILDIHSGKVPRPKDYNNFHWILFPSQVKNSKKIQSPLLFGPWWKRLGLPIKILKRSKKHKACLRSFYIWMKRLFPSLMTFTGTKKQKVLSGSFLTGKRPWTFSTIRNITRSGKKS